MAKVVSPGWPDEVSEEFNAESPRALVILAAAMLDQALKRLLQTYLVASPTRDDDLFDGSNAPMGHLSSRIDFSYRLGLISNEMCRDLHLIRKIRNEFAHNITNCTFENEKVKSRIFELRKSIPLFSNSKFQSIVDTDRKAFQTATGVIQVSLQSIANKTTPMKQQSLEWFYKITEPKKKKSKQGNEKESK